jgi:hypothetical protein
MPLLVPETMLAAGHTHMCKISSIRGKFWGVYKRGCARCRTCVDICGFQDGWMDVLCVCICASSYIVSHHHT